MLIQTINVRESVKPTHVNKSPQRGLRQPINVHSWFAYKMLKSAKFLSFTMRINAVDGISIIYVFDFNRFTAARTNCWIVNAHFHWPILCRKILENLRNNHICFIYFNLISNIQIKVFKIA